MRQPARRRAARRAAFGSVAALASMTLFTAAMVPVRGHLSIAIAALILVVPVVVGVVTGGFLAGVVSVAVGFLTYNYFFIPPYGTLQVGAAENWAVLVVYAVVMIPVARVVATMITARAEAQQRGVQLRRLLDVSSLLIEDRPVDELLHTVVEALRDVALLAAAGARFGVKSGAHLSAVAAGVCFAMTAVFMKLTVADLLDHGVAATATDWPGYLLAVSTSAGLLLGQHAYASGPLPWAIAARGVTNPVVSFTVGIVAFQVALPRSPWALAGIAAGGVLIVTGVTGLSHSATTKVFYGEAPNHDDKRQGDTV